MKKIVYVFIACLITLCSCAKGRGFDSEQSYWSYSAFAKGNDLYFYMINDYSQQRTNIMYWDKNTGQNYFCNSEECMHNTVECSSYEIYGGFLPESIWYYNDKIYV